MEDAAKKVVDVAEGRGGMGRGEGCIQRQIVAKAMEPVVVVRGSGHGDQPALPRGHVFKHGLR